MSDRAVYPSAGQGVIEGLEDAEQFDHPMWRLPNLDDKVPQHVLAMRRRLASLLTPFDGKPGDHQTLLLFAKEVWTASQMDGDDNDPVWLIGQMWLIRCRLVRVLQARRANTTGYLHRRLTQFVEVIDRWTQELSVVVADTHNSRTDTGRSDTTEGTP